MRSKKLANIFETALVTTMATCRPTSFARTEDFSGTLQDF